MVTRRRARRDQLFDVLLAIGAAGFDIWICLFALPTDTNGSFRSTGLVLPSALVVVLCTLGGAALLVRRRWPLQVFVAVWILAMVPVAISPDLQPFMALLVAMFALAVRVRSRPAVWVLVATLIVFAGQAINNAPVDIRTDPVGWSIATLIFNGVMPTLVWAAARLRWRAVHRISNLERRREAEIQAAVRAERSSVSRDLHDIISHSVSAMTLQAAGAKAVMSDQPERVRPALDAIEQTGVQAISELQRLLQVLRSAGEVPEQARARDRLSQLPALIDRARQTGQQVELEISGTPCELDPSVELTCYRVVQEALNNASRHAGSDADVQVRLDWLPPRLRTSVINSGGTPGTAGAGLSLSTGHGLIGLAERVQLVGGELQTDALPDGGFRIEAILPVSAPPGVERAVGTDNTSGS